MALSNTPILQRNARLHRKVAALLKQSGIYDLKIKLPDMSSADSTDSVIEQVTQDRDTPITPPEDDCTLFGHAYVALKLIQKTSQGEIIEVVDILTLKKYIIKKVAKGLCSKKISKKGTDGHHVINAKDISKEVLLLHHTTKANTSPCHYICELIQFFEDDEYYYLVLEHGGDMTLKTWCDLAFKYMKNGKLDVRKYRNICKYIMWQIVVLMYWLHKDMSMAYLSDIFDHILLKNAEFIIDSKTGMVSVNTEIEIKLCDLSLAEIWKNGDNKLCEKHCGDGHSQYSAPQIFENSKVYNAEKADSWSLGILLFRMLFNQNPFQFQDSKSDQGFAGIKKGNIGDFIKQNHSSEYATNQFIMSLLNGLLCYDEERRMSIGDILHCRWFRSYWNNYKNQIISTSFSQQQQLRRPAQKLNMSTFPYYDKQNV